MGDEMHMRNAAATGLLARRLAAPLVAVVRRSRPARGDHAVPDARQRPVLPRVVDVRGQGGGAGDRRARRARPSSRRWRATGWSSASASRGWATDGSPGPPAPSRASTFPGSRPATPTSTPATRRSWRRTASAGIAMAASPAVQKIVGAKSFADAVATSRRWRRSASGRIRSFRWRRSDGEGTPTGIDVRKVVQTGIVPPINTAIAHRSAHRMIGAGIATPPLQPFVDALVAFGERLPRREGAAPHSRAPLRRDPLVTMPIRGAGVALVLSGLDGAHAPGRGAARSPGRLSGRRPHGHPRQPRAPCLGRARPSRPCGGVAGRSDARGGRRDRRSGRGRRSRRRRSSSTSAAASASRPAACCRAPSSRRSGSGPMRTSRSSPCPAPTPRSRR